VQFKRRILPQANATAEQALALTALRFSFLFCHLPNVDTVAISKSHDDGVLLHRERAVHHLSRMLSALEEKDDLRTILHQTEFDIEMAELFARRVNVESAD
jgi:hypothetical protein